jgi:hypothetical protein
MSQSEQVPPPKRQLSIKHLGPEVRAEVSAVFTQALQTKTNLNSDAVQATVRALQEVLPNLMTVATSNIFDVITQGPTTSAANCSGGIVCDGQGAPGDPCGTEACDTEACGGVHSCGTEACGSQACGDGHSCDSNTEGTHIFESAAMQSVRGKLDLLATHPELKMNLGLMLNAGKLP